MIEEAVLRDIDDFQYEYMLKDYHELCGKLQTQEVADTMVREIGELS